MADTVLQGEGQSENFGFEKVTDFMMNWCWWGERVEVEGDEKENNEIVLKKEMCK